MSENKDKLPESIKCPRQLFGYDLSKAIEKYTDKGNQLIVCGDFNSQYEDLSN